MKLADIEFNCKTCGKVATWSVGEQKFMHKLKEDGKIEEIHSPRNCSTCRAKKKEAENGGH